MQSLYVSLPTVKVVQKFVAQISKLDGNFDLQSGKYVLDAKSLMGILSLNLSAPLKLTVEKDTAETMKIVRRFAASESGPVGMDPQQLRTNENHKNA